MKENENLWTWREIVADFAKGIVLGAAFAAVLCLLGGCMSENTGSSTIVGEQIALPEITDSSDSIAVRVYESIEGARVWTARDSKVSIYYENVYTNDYMGMFTTRKSMQLYAEIEPLEVGGGEDGGGEPDGGPAKEGE